MADRTPDVYLHIGAMKTGTSYLQQLLVENKQALANDGVLFPGRQGWGEQVRGVRDVLRLAADDEMRVGADGAWDRLLGDIHAFDGRAALLSMEFMSFARPPRAEALVHSLAPANVHVVLTVRDAGRVLPAQWQESTQNRGTASWSDYTAAVLRGAGADSKIWRTSMRALNIPRMLSVWAPLVRADRLHLVLVPPPGAPSTQLWERFAAAVGVDPARYQPPRRRRNESLGHVSADLMRRVNVDLRELPVSSYQRTVKAYLCKQVLASRTGEPKVTMTSALADFAARWDQTMSDAITASGGKVYGDLADLHVRPEVTSDSIAPVPEAALLDAAADAVIGLDQLVETRRRRVDALRPDEHAAAESADPPESYIPAGGSDHEDLKASWSRMADPVESAVAQVVATARLAADLRLERKQLTDAGTTRSRQGGRPRELSRAVWRRLHR